MGEFKSFTFMQDEPKPAKRNQSPKALKSTGTFAQPLSKPIQQFVDDSLEVDENPTNSLFEMRDQLAFLQLKISTYCSHITVEQVRLIVA